MHIAQIAPLTEAVPPKLYGGTERVVHWLTEELVALGHEVTLFASGDSARRRSSKRSGRGAAARRSIRDPNALHMHDARARPRSAPTKFDVLHFHLDYYPFSLFARQPTPFLTTLHGRLDLPEHQPLFDTFSDAAGRLDLERAAAAAAAGELGPDDPSRPAGKPADAAAGQAGLSRVSRPHRAGEGRRPRDPHRPSSAAFRSRSRPRSIRPTATTSRSRSSRMIDGTQRRIHRRDQRRGKVRVPQRRDRAAGPDRLAGAVRPGDDRGDGLRHAGDRVQSRLGAGDHRGRRHRLHRRGRAGRDRRGRPAARIVARRRSARVSRSASRRAAWRKIISRSIAA